MKFSLRINIKMPTIVGMFIFISTEIYCSAMFSKEELTSVSSLRFISRTNFMLSQVEHETKFYNPGACIDQCLRPCIRIALGMMLFYIWAAPCANVLSICGQRRPKSGPEVIKLFSCSTRLSMKSVLLINLKLNMKMPAEKISCAAELSMKKVL